MKKIVLLSLFACCLSTTVVSQIRNEENPVIEERLNAVQDRLERIDNKLSNLSRISTNNKHEIQILMQQNESLQQKIDSLKTACENLKKTQVAEKLIINEKIQSTNDSIVANQSALKNHAILGGISIVVILFAIILITYFIIKRMRKGNYSIDEVRKTQNILLSTQTKMQEESVKLDNKLLELVDKQLSSIAMPITSAAPDHSLALKVADEIVRIEMNLSRMDASVKGYKQLSKAVQRIKDNFKANGYEIVDMLGKPYVAGMKAAVTFVTDESLDKGQQIITKIIKPQINYQQQMIQAAQIEVSQPE